MKSICEAASAEAVTDTVEHTQAHSRHNELTNTLAAAALTTSVT